MISVLITTESRFLMALNERSSCNQSHATTFVTFRGVNVINGIDISNAVGLRFVSSTVTHIECSYSLCSSFSIFRYSESLKLSFLSEAL